MTYKDPDPRIIRECPLCGKLEKPDPEVEFCNEDGMKLVDLVCPRCDIPLDILPGTIYEPPKVAPFCCNCGIQVTGLKETQMMSRIE